MIDKFEQDDFPAKERQPYYYDDLGNIKKSWSKEILSVEKKGDHGMHKQSGFLLRLDHSPGPREIVYGTGKGYTPKRGDTLKFNLNEEVSKELDYPSYSVILERHPTLLNRLLSKLRILK
tara:strand:+ start:121 stop:480 length:360 start_codon:yes stop_codon:yes gene_type:complete